MYGVQKPGKVLSSVVSLWYSLCWLHALETSAPFGSPLPTVFQDDVCTKFLSDQFPVNGFDIVTWCEAISHRCFSSIQRGYFYCGNHCQVMKYALRSSHTVNPLTAKLFNLNFHPLEVVSRWRDPQLQESENYSDLTKWRSTAVKYCWLMSYFIFNMFKCGT